MIVSVALGAGAIVAAAIFGGNLFDLLVNEPNLVQGFPQSLEHIRKYWIYRNPGDFFKVLTPLFLVFTVVGLIADWQIASERMLILAALCCYLVTQAITIFYFFPQNRVLREGSEEAVRALIATHFRVRGLLDLTCNLFTLAACVFELIVLASPHVR